jgi:hypothetical protein
MTQRSTPLHGQRRDEGLDGPDFDLRLAIENTDLRTMNDMVRTYGKFDVVAGVFSFYAELAVKNAEILGWVKPLFRDVQAYDPAQDRNKSAMRRLYEKSSPVSRRS